MTAAIRQQQDLGKKTKHVSGERGGKSGLSTVSKKHVRGNERETSLSVSRPEIEGKKNMSVKAKEARSDRSQDRTPSVQSNDRSLRLREEGPPSTPSKEVSKGLRGDGGGTNPLEWQHFQKGCCK